MPPKVPKRTRKPVHLTVPQKLELIKKLKEGKSVARVCEEYGVKKQTVSDIRRQEDKLKAYAVKFSIQSMTKKSENKARKHMKVSSNVDLDAAVYKWYVQQRSCGIPVCGCELAASAAKLAEHMGIANFKASDGWLWRFRNRHGLHNVVMRGEAGSARSEDVEPFRLKLHDLIQKEGLALTQLYNVDESGIMWRSLPKNTQARKDEDRVPGKKINKERLSIMCGSNATGSHLLKLTVVGKSAKPHALNHVDHSKLPVHYYHSKKAWFNQYITDSWFHSHLVPEIRNYQEKELKIPPSEVKALVLMDNAPAHPDADTLVSRDGRIQAMFLPPNTTSLIQPMDQGVISAFKRRYQRQYLNEVLVVIEDEADISMAEDTRGKRTLANIKAYNIRSAIYNMAEAWKNMKTSTFANAWKKLLQDIDANYDFEGFEAADFHQVLRKAGETAVTLEDVHDWLELNENTPGHEIMSDEEIAASVTGPQTVQDGSDDEGEDNMAAKMKLSEVRDCIDKLYQYVAASDDHEIQVHYDQIRLLRGAIMKKQHTTGRQSKITSFFAPAAKRPKLQDSAPRNSASTSFAPELGSSDVTGATSESE